MAQHMLTIFLADISGIASVGRGAHASGEVFCIGEQRPPLGLQEVDDGQVLTLLLEVRSLGGKKVHVGVP